MNSNNQPEMDPQERAALLQEGLISTLPSNEDFGTIKLTSENRKLLTILPNGEVVADDIVTASEAGRVFIESMMMQGKPLLSRIQQLEEENELLKQKIKTYEVHQDN